MLMVSGNTGRIKKLLRPSARRILFESDTPDELEQQLTVISHIDFAHVLMLAEENVIRPELAQRLLQAIRHLVQQGFGPLKSRSPVRGAFLLYESYLIETHGAEVGGLLQVGRSRNDLNATVLRLRLRKPYVQLVNTTLRLQAVLIRNAADNAGVIMPAYTHGQAAEAISYGHYLGACAEAIRRDLDGLISAAQEIDTSPLGAGAVAGTSVPINCTRTAELLGFSHCSLNSIDAVASRDLVLRLLAAMAIYAATLSRIATDLLQWLTAEFQFLSLPDDMVGSSSAMPQKRNPFLLEHVQGRTASALGGFVSALSATRNTPFTNTIAVSSESVRPIWSTLKDVCDATTLLRLVLSHARPCADRMLSRATDGFTNATALATRLVLEKGMDFRSAHHLVGTMITKAIRDGTSSLDKLPAADASASFQGLDPGSCVARSRYGGGPAPESLAISLGTLRDSWLRHRRLIRNQTGRWADAEDKLKGAVRDFSKPQTSSKITG